jgi:hypothetical protein
MLSGGPVDDRECGTRADVAKAGVGDYVEIKYPRPGPALVCYGVVDENHELVPIEGHSWPGLAAVIVAVAKGGLIISHKKGTWTPPPAPFS